METNFSLLLLFIITFVEVLVIGTTFDVVIISRLFRARFVWQVSEAITLKRLISRQNVHRAKIALKDNVIVKYGVACRKINYPIRIVKIRRR